MTIIKKLALAGSVAAIAIAAPAQAAPYTPPSANGKATVRLYSAITLTNVSDIDLGTVIRQPLSGGQVDISSTGVITCNSAGVSCTGAASEGHFKIMGDANSNMSVTISGGDFDAASNILTLKNGTDAVQLALQYAGMTQDVVSSVPQSTFSLTGTGAETDIKLYGSLTFSGPEVDPNGLYEGFFTLTADYK